MKEAKQWWESLNYNEKKKYSEGYFDPTVSSLDPIMWLDNETIFQIYSDLKKQ